MAQLFEAHDRAALRDHGVLVRPAHRRPDARRGSLPLSTDSRRSVRNPIVEAAMLRARGRHRHRRRSHGLHARRAARHLRLPRGADPGRVSRVSRHDGRAATSTMRSSIASWCPRRSAATTPRSSCACRRATRSTTPAGRDPNAAPRRDDAGLPPDAFVFCCFNNNFKLTPRIFDRLDAHPARRRGQRAVAHGGQPVGGRQSSQRSARTRGIDAGRLVFAPRVPLARASRAPSARRSLPRHASLQRPHDGERRAVDGLAGAHVHRGVVRRPRGGEPSACGRACRISSSRRSTLTRNVRRRSRAIALARDARAPGNRFVEQARARASCRDAPLFDAGVFARDLENAYRAMHARKLAGLLARPHRRRGSDIVSLSKQPPCPAKRRPPSTSA